MASPKSKAARKAPPAPKPGTDKVVLGLHVLVAIAAGVLAWWASVWAGTNLVATHPIGYRENAIVLSTKLVLEGKNPYSLQYQPLYVNVYGILYAAVVSLPAHIWGPTYAVHRAVSLFFLVASCALIGYALRRRGSSWPMSATGAMILFVLLAGDLNIESRPDTLGLFLMLASLVVPWSRKFSTGSLVASGLLSILGLLTKPYCVLGALLVAAYVFLFRGKARGLIFGGALCAALAAAVLAVNACLECYWTNVFFINLNSVGPSRSGVHFERMLRGYADLLWGLLVLVGLCAAAAVYGALRPPDPKDPTRKPLAWDLRHVRRPLLDAGWDLGTFVLVCNAGVMLWPGKMGWHNGANTLYWHHLLSPWLVWVGLPLVSVARWRWLKLLAGAVALMTIVWMGYRLRPTLEPKDYSMEWGRLESLLAPYKNVLSAPPLCGLLAKDHKPFYDTGQTEYVLWGDKNNPCRVAEDYRKAGADYMERIHQDLVNRKFDLVCVSPWQYGKLVSLDDLLTYYNPVKSMPVPTSYNPSTVDLWLPKK